MAVHLAGVNHRATGLQDVMKIPFRGFQQYRECVIISTVVARTAQITESPGMDRKFQTGGGTLQVRWCRGGVLQMQGDDGDP